MHIQALRVSSVLMHANTVHNTWVSMGIRAGATTFFITTLVRRWTYQRGIAKASMALLHATFAASIRPYLPISNIRGHSLTHPVGLLHSQLMHLRRQTAWDLVPSASVYRSRIRLIRLPSPMPP